MDITLTREGLQAIDDLLLDTLDSEVELLTDASRHIISSGGKHLRPHVALLSHLAAGATTCWRRLPWLRPSRWCTRPPSSTTTSTTTPCCGAAGRLFMLAGAHLCPADRRLHVRQGLRADGPYGPTYNVIMARACSELVGARRCKPWPPRPGPSTADLQAYRGLKTASLF